jgi:protoheme IX farnesyltransferase
MKRVSSFSTIVGAIPGALPPVMGWTAVTGTIGWEGCALFALLFVWQIPHFLSIAWIYREDYARASFPILTVVDSQGKLASVQVVLYSLVLIPVSLLPTLHGVTGSLYFYGAAFLGVVFATFGARWAWHRSLSTARQLFLVSILYLPVLGALLLWDRRAIP